MFRTNTVTVTLKEKDAETAYEANCTIAEDGTWEVTLDAKECGGDYTMTVKMRRRNKEIYKYYLWRCLSACRSVKYGSMVELD